ncbi:hypothetical protein EDB83DRAFT_2532848 [Lactarius deliciosus]|nr:hypothetical protein EDB83DRAFT_2532848 [Lactarius deliciosus]
MPPGDRCAPLPPGLIGRGIPDIAAQVLNFEIVIDREFEEVDGTSGSAPLALAAQRTDRGWHYFATERLPPLEKQAPWLYSFGLPGLNDITLGSNPGYRADGFPTIAGWDPVHPAKFVSLHFYVG